MVAVHQTIFCNDGVVSYLRSERASVLAPPKRYSVICNGGDRVAWRKPSQGAGNRSPELRQNEMRRNSCVWFSMRKRNTATCFCRHPADMAN